MPRLVVVGGNAAGLAAAAKAKRKRSDLEIIVLEQGEHASFSSCGIPHMVAGDIRAPDALLVLDEAQMQERGLDVRLRTKAVAFNPYTKAVAFDGPGGRDEMTYDKLLLATGTRPRNPFPGGELEGVHALRHHDDGVRLMRDLQARKTKRAVVVGAGYVGLEMAEGLHRHGAEVHMVTRGERVLSDFDAELTEGLPDYLAEHGVKVHTGVPEVSFEAAASGGGKRLGTVHAHKALKADIAVVAVGLQPNTEMAVKAGVAATREGYILVDDNMRTNYHDVWAAGDCVAPRHLLTGRPTPIPLGLPSNRMGRVAGDAIAASLEKFPVPASSFPGVIGTVATRAFGLCFAKTGLTEADAKEERLDVETSLIEAKASAGYMPGAGDVAVKMVADRDTQKLLGCQLIGPEESALRIDAAAIAVQTGVKVGKLADIEMAYSPKMSPVWDPLLVCAGDLAKKLRK